MTLSSLWHTVYPVLIAILFFELIILVHEGGHYIAARLMKIKVNEFSVGMGPKIIQRERNGTKFTLRWILFGGYCQMEGEGEDSEDPNAFNKKSVPARLFVVVAGALMNLVLGFLLTVLIVCGSNLIGTAQVAKFEANAASAASGLQVGDTIQSIDGMRVYTATDVTTGLSRSADDTLTVVVKRDGAKKTLQVKFDTEEYEGHRFVKMDFWLHGVPKNVGNVLRESVMQTVSYARMVFLSVADMLSGRFGLADISGPVGAVSYVSQAVKTSAYSALRLMAILTINVGLFNLFPIPALDGWRLFLLVGEGICKRKLPDKAEWVINAAGLALLLHNFPEGVLTFFAGTADPSLGLRTAAAIALHNIPEGLAVAVPFAYATRRRTAGVLAALVSGLAEPLGAVLAWLFLRRLFTPGFLNGTVVLAAGVLWPMAFRPLSRLGQRGEG